jgi:hypothetical protein
MAERFRQVHPDQIVTFNDGRELAVVSEEHFVNEVAKIASFIAFAGGTMSAVVYRQPTDLRGEMVTVGAVLSWADFTKTRAQPEPASMPPGYEDEPPTPDEVVADVQESRDGGLGAAALPFQDSGETPGIGGAVGPATRRRGRGAGNAGRQGLERGRPPDRRARDDRRRRADPAAPRP